MPARAATEALFDVSTFRVAAGQALAVEGANGAGKTSLLRLIAGFLTPAAGGILVRPIGRDSDDGEERGHYIGWLGHQDGLKPQLSVREQLASSRASMACSDADADRCWSGSGSRGSAICPAAISPPDRRSGWRLARLLLSGRRCGCWTSLSPRWTPQDSA